MPGSLGRAIEREKQAVRAVLIEARERAGLSQEVFAARIGWPQSAVWRVEQGERRLDVAELFLWAPALGTTAEAIVRRVRKRLEG